MLKRRLFLQSKMALPFLGGWFSRVAPAAAAKRDYFRELGLREFINAAEPFTALTGSLTPPELVDAYSYASERYVRLDELHDAVGKRIAEMIGCEAAMVTSGCAAALTLGTAACLTGLDRDRIRRLPDTTGMKNEVLIQKSHRYGYDHAVRNTGIRYVEIESAEELERAISDRTAMLHFFNTNEPVGRIRIAEFAAIARKHRIPALNDIAADVPPIENLSRSIKLGYDLVTVSGGKGLCGPQSCGLLYGRKDLIAAARLNAPPNSDSIGRGMKVNKEELVAMMVTLERYFHRDHQADWKEWERRVAEIADTVSSLSGVRPEPFMPEIHYRVPHLRILWDPAVRKISVADMVRQLREGDPSIEVRPAREALELGVWMLRPGEAKTVARRIRDLLKSA
ncbi:MAG: aminotransferase class V-fold PLP-dependent enzyme [Bryobacteraceae bacterium]